MPRRVRGGWAMEGFRLSDERRKEGERGFFSTMVLV